MAECEFCGRPAEVYLIDEDDVLSLFCSLIHLKAWLDEIII